MKLTNLLVILSLFSFVVACGGGESESSETDQAPADDVRTINIIGIDAMKFAVEEPAEGITVGDTTGSNNDLLLLETIEVEPGEEIRIRLTTRSTLPATAMAHNWILMVQEADATAYVRQAIQARDQDYMPAELSDQVLEYTGLAAGGETTEVTFTAPTEPGKYEYICSFPGHYAAGMKGFLVVQSEESEEEPAE